MADDSSSSLRPPANKPGTSCLGCRRRKLKCSRESEGCQNCSKSDLPCVYPAPEVGVKRKRGPYKKDKPARQRHLEDLVKYLEPKSGSPDSAGQAESPGGSQALPQLPGAIQQAASSGATNGRTAAQLAASEDLVKDALIALTKSSVSDQDTSHIHRRDGAFFAQNQGTATRNSSTPSIHPSPRRLFEYWQIFTTRVDPMTKIVHCPSFGKKLLAMIDKLPEVASTTEALLFSIYYAAVSTCTAREAQKRFGECQDVLLKLYGRAIEAALSDNYEMPTLESLQALILYIVCIRRQNDDTNVRALFSLAVRSAQMTGMQNDPGNKYSVFETQMRRRLWFHLYGLENKSAEEGGTRGISIMANSTVELPANLNDADLDPDLIQMPKPRVGVTNMTFNLLRFEIHKLVFNLYNIRRQWASGNWQSTTGSRDVRDEQQKLFDDTKSRLEAQYSTHLDDSRSYDHMCLGFLEAMLIKARLTIDFPFGAIPGRSMPAPTKSMPNEERMTLLGASVRIIKLTHEIAVSERCTDWLWYFRGYVQWHSLAIIVAELGCSTNPTFTNAAWQVLDPILADWDTMYKVKHNEPAWDHVNSMITRARNLRAQRQGKQRDGNHASIRDPPHSMCGAPINADHIMPIQDGRSLYPAYNGLGAAQTAQPSFEDTTMDYTANSGASASQSPLLAFDMHSDDMTNLDNIDFEAFDQVFGTASWGLMDPFDDINGQLEVVQRCERHMDEENR